MFIKPYEYSCDYTKPLSLANAELAVAFLPVFSEATRGYITDKLRLRQKRGGCSRTVEELRFVIKPFGAEANDEAYELLLGRTTEIGAQDPRSLLLGFAALLQLADQGEMYEGRLFSFPNHPFRAYRTYLPAPDRFKEFYEAVDMIAYYQYNTMTMEVGGAMEYRLHPEINQEWAAWAKPFRENPGSAGEMQNSMPWLKNSLDADNAEGHVLTQAQVRELIEYCNARGIEVYPEVPTMSHANYLLLPHREFAEIREDPNPDVYCPNAPGLYDYVFDVMGEIIDVFRPRYVHIGHDELYNAGVCPRCKGQLPYVLYSNDIIRIHDWLAEKGIKCMMWGEKLLPAFKGTCGYGGAGMIRQQTDGSWKSVSPVLYECVTMLPRDILMLHWYWSFDKELDKVYGEYGYPMAYGNSCLLSMEDWEHRREGTLGAAVSNWGSFEDEYMQRNMQYYALVGNAYILAGYGFDSNAKARGDEIDKVIAEIYRYRHMDAPPEPVRVVHTTDYGIPYTYFYDGAYVDDRLYLLGEYRLTYDDGFTASLPVRYGSNISNCGTADKQGQSIADTMMTDKKPYRLSEQYREVAGKAIPRTVDGTVWYETEYPNPHPGHRLASYSYEPVIREAAVRTRSLRIG